MKFIWSVAALALALPAAAAAEGAASPQVEDLSRCAGVYKSMSDIAEDGSEAGAHVSYRFLQFYVLLAYIAESDAADAITGDSVAAMTDADTARVKAKVDAALAKGESGEILAAETAVCEAIIKQNADIFELVDKKIEEMQAASG
ncbi:MAG: hypothetical protein IBJ13_00025 [Sphingopyxis sp.]|nr:hypothetical protein [Sphingopyxis sp.]